jgi:hypothetical protein
MHSCLLHTKARFDRKGSFRFIPLHLPSRHPLQVGVALYGFKHRSGSSRSRFSRPEPVPTSSLTNRSITGVDHSRMPLDG